MFVIKLFFFFFNHPLQKFMKESESAPIPPFIFQSLRCLAHYLVGSCFTWFCLCNFFLLMCCCCWRQEGLKDLSKNAIYLYPFLTFSACMLMEGVVGIEGDFTYTILFLFAATHLLLNLGRRLPCRQEQNKLSVPFLFLYL